MDVSSMFPPRLQDVATDIGKVLGAGTSLCLDIRGNNDLNLCYNMEVTWIHKLHVMSIMHEMENKYYGLDNINQQTHDTAY